MPAAREASHRRPEVLPRREKRAASGSSPAMASQGGEAVRCDSVVVMRDFGTSSAANRDEHAVSQLGATTTRLPLASLFGLSLGATRVRAGGATSPPPHRGLAGATARELAPPPWPRRGLAPPGEAAPPEDVRSWCLVLGTAGRGILCSIFLSSSFHRLEFFFRGRSREHGEEGRGMLDARATLDTGSQTDSQTSQLTDGRYKIDGRAICTRKFQLMLYKKIQIFK